jgi:hypothetical protein
MKHNEINDRESIAGKTESRPTPREKVTHCVEFSCEAKIMGFVMSTKAVCQLPVIKPAIKQVIRH